MSDYQSRIKRRNLAQRRARKALLTKGAILFSLLFFLTSVTISFIVIIKDAPEITSELLEKKPEQAGYNYVKVSIKDVPKLVKQAFIATEDARFYNHFGIDIWRIFGALIEDLKKGYWAEGASTITQQVVKNTMLSSEKTLNRKIQEVYLAIKLEQRYTKPQILELYLNKIYFGEGVYGIAAAAEEYYGKTLNELSLEEVAMLAGMPKAPSHYNPYKRPKLTEERRNTVLRIMYENGEISKEKFEKAKNTRVTASLIPDED